MSARETRGLARLLLPALLPSLLLGLLALLPGRAAAQQNASLQAAEEAYTQVDFEQTRSSALEALHGGELNSRQIVRAYQLLGISSAALGEEDASREYFVTMLGVDPQAELDESVPPRLRGGFFEARGVWSAQAERLGIEVGLARSQSSVRVALSDPMGIARTVEVHARLEGGTSYETQRAEAAPVVLARLDGAGDADRVEYFVRVLDEWGNSILEQGSEFEPSIVGRQSFGSGGGEQGESIIESPWLWTIIGVVVVGAAAVTAGVLIEQRSHIGLQTDFSIGID